MVEALKSSLKGFNRRDLRAREEAVLRGLASVFDIFGYRAGAKSRDPFEEDLKSLQRDWQVVARDYQRALARYEREHEALAGQLSNTREDSKSAERQLSLFDKDKR